MSASIPEDADDLKYIRAHVTEMSAFIFGVKDQGGLVRELQSVKNSMDLLKADMDRGFSAVDGKIEAIRTDSNTQFTIVKEQISSLKEWRSNVNGRMVILGAIGALALNLLVQKLFLEQKEKDPKYDQRKLENYDARNPGSSAGNR